MVNKMIAMRCDEVRPPQTPYKNCADQQELLSFLKHTKDFWGLILDQNESAMAKLDRTTVMALELTAPGASAKEAKDLHSRIQSGQLLSAFSDAERQMIWSRLCAATTDCLVPSLHAYFENLKYLRVAADSMKRLLHLERKETIRAALELSFQDEPEGGNECLIQDSRSSFLHVPSHGINRFDLMYRQCWLFALRDYRDVPAETKKKLAGPKNGHVDETILFAFASLAYKLGFRTEKISALLQQDPDREIAYRLLKTARKPDQFEYDDLETAIRAVTSAMAQARSISIDIVTDEDDVEAQLKSPARCGIPNILDQARDKPLMFLDKLHASVPRGRSDLTSFFIQRSIYFGFFGREVGFSTDDFNVFRRETVALNIGLSQPTLQGRAEDQNQRRLESLVRVIQEKETTLEQLTRTEREFKENLEQLYNNTRAQETQLLASQKDEQESRDRLDRLKQTEAEQIIRLETLKTQEQAKEARIGELEQTQNDLGEEIRLDLLAADRREAVAQEETSQMSRMAELRNRQHEKQASLGRLAAEETEGNLRLEQLQVEEQGLSRRVQELSSNIDHLNEQQQAKIQTMEAVEQSHKAIIDSLVADELERRKKIDQLKACQEHLQAKVDQAGVEEAELRQSIERLGALERQRQLGISPEPLRLRGSEAMGNLMTRIEEDLRDDSASH